MSARLAAAAATLAAAGGALCGCVLDLDGLTGGGACCLGAGAQCAPCRVACAADDCDGGPCVLAQGEGELTGIAVSGQYVLWTARGGDRVRRLDLVSGRVDDLMSGTPRPTWIVATAQHAVWVAENGIWRCPVASARCDVDARAIFLHDAQGASLVQGLAADDAAAFWTEDSGGSSGSPILRCGLEASCAHADAVLFSNTSHPRGIAVDARPDGFVYWATAGDGIGGGAVSRMRKDAAPDSSYDAVAAPIDAPWALALGAGRVVWTKVPATGPGAVLQCPQGSIACRGTAVTPVLQADGPSIDRALDIASDGERVAWTNNAGGSVMQCALPQCVGLPLVVADGQQQPRGVAMSESCVYWVDQTDGGRVLRKAK